VDAKHAGNKKGLKLTADEIEKWNNISVDVQKEICKYKIENYDVVKDDLTKSGDKKLVHSASRFNKIENCFWDGRASLNEAKDEINIEGINMLGNLWMELRAVM